MKALSVLVAGRPDSIRHTSVLVPPMSQVMKSASATEPAIQVAPATPPAGPERIVRTGRVRAVSRSITPPAEDIVSTGPR